MFVNLILIAHVVSIVNYFEFRRKIGIKKNNALKEVSTFKKIQLTIESLLSNSEKNYTSNYISLSYIPVPSF